MAGVEIRLEGEATALAALSQAHDTLEYPLGMYEAIGASMVESTKQRFDRGESPEGNPWPVSLRAQFEGGKTLIDKGALKQSITHIADQNGVEIGTNMHYAATHQFGATISASGADALRFSIPGIGFITKKSVTIPARPFIGLSGEDEAEIEAIAFDFIAEAFGGAGDAG
ncbi:MAG: phage virion morphogenesis protein [Rhodobacteraceae bacterium]|nr:phage virion morphogenesis protein [Paracoccaceae bacterium]